MKRNYYLLTHKTKCLVVVSAVSAPRALHLAVQAPHRPHLDVAVPHHQAVAVGPGLLVVVPHLLHVAVPLQVPQVAVVLGHGPVVPPPLPVAVDLGLHVQVLPVHHVVAQVHRAPHVVVQAVQAVQYRFLVLPVQSHFHVLPVQSRSHVPLVHFHVQVVHPVDVRHQVQVHAVGLGAHVRPVQAHVVPVHPVQALVDVQVQAQVHARVRHLIRAIAIAGVRVQAHRAPVHAQVHQAPVHVAAQVLRVHHVQARARQVRVVANDDDIAEDITANHVIADVVAVR